MFLGVDGVEDIELDVIGYEYGVCEKVEIVGDLLSLEIYFLKKRGVHRITITDTKNSRSFGHEAAKKNEKDMEESILRFADGNKRPLGLNGRWKNQGLTALGIITLDT